jgi:predicted negative regulator of RcsB-dependent stress response
VEETFDFFTTHRQQAIRIGGAVLALILIVAATLYYRGYEQGVREQQLGDAIALQASFPNEPAKKDAVAKAYAKIVAEHGGSNEAYIAEYTLASLDMDAGKFDAARTKYQDVADHAGANYASLAKLSLAQLAAVQNKTAEAQSLLKDLIDHPTDLVSKNQATFELAKVLAPTQPAEAKKLLTPLASAAGDFSQAASTALGELQQQK